MIDFIIGCLALWAMAIVIKWICKGDDDEY